MAKNDKRLNSGLGDWLAIENVSNRHFNLIETCAGPKWRCPRETAINLEYPWYSVIQSELKIGRTISLQAIGRRLHCGV